VTEYATIGLERTGGVGRIELRRPDSLNAWNEHTAPELFDAVQALAADPQVRCVVITGAGRAFSAGADVKSAVMTQGPEAIIRELREVTNPLLLAIRRMPKPVIAAVNGPAAGIGCSLALACDLVVAAESAYFLLAFSRIGLTPDGGSSLFVAARVGHARAFRMALLAERVSARDACDWGLIDHVAPDDEHPALVDTLARGLAAGPTRAYAATKRTLNAALYSRLEEQFELEASAQAELLAGADYAEGVAAFTEKRPPAFAG
jgi:2-(1,2-epoxy-1,2-dihydrophenyl)acetyl-CoA isomerase